jgi:RHS repeat-associated protein
MARTDPVGATTEYERDPRGRLLAVTDALGQVTRVERDGNGLPVVITNPAGGVTRIERDPHGNVLLVTDAMGGVTAWRYDTRGLPLERVSPTGARSTYAYDAHANLERMTLPNGGVFRYVWDALGRLLARVDPLGAETRYAYSNRGDLTAVRDALGQVTRYADDGERHLLRIEDPLGQATELTWGGYHKLCARRDANGNVVHLQYNLEGELTHVWNERGELHRLEYTTDGKLKREVTFDGRDLRYRSDAAGHVIRIENGAREATVMEYDLLGRLSKRELHDGSEESFAYDPLSNLVEAQNGTGRFLFERDLLGRVVREAQNTSGEEHWTEVRYDAEGQRIGRTTSLGHLEAVTRGLLGERRETLLDGDHLVRHDADLLGRETARALPRGGWLQSQYDALGRVARRRAGGTASEPWSRPDEPEWIGARPDRVGVDTVYRYDPAGELVESIDQSRGRTTYSYDRIGQLLSMVPEKARAELFRYDATGNLFEADVDAAGRVYGKGNRLLRKGDTEYVWDDDGRLAEKRTRSAVGAEEIWKYRWDAAGLLKRVERPDGLLAEFAYDPFARRMSKRVSTPARGDDAASVVTTRFVWDGDVLVHEVAKQAAAVGDPIVEERTYCFEDRSFVPVAHKERTGTIGAEACEWFHYLNDPIGTPARLLGADGHVACELPRSAWGDAQVSPTRTWKTSIRSQGQYNDSDILLCYNRFRFYDPDLGRFISADPLGPPTGLHAYRFAPNALTWIDPFGLAHQTSGSIVLPDGTEIPLGTTSATSPDPSGHSEREMLRRAADAARAARPGAENPMEGITLRMHNQYDPCPDRSYGPRSCQSYLTRAANKGNMRIDITSDQSDKRRDPRPPWSVDRRPGFPSVDPDPRYAR